MATDPTFMPVDYTGTSPSNRIHDEQHILNRADPRDHRIVVPKFAPFYNNQGASDNKLKVVFHNPLTSESKVLVEGVDFYCTHFFIDASRATARPIYGSIEILDDTLEGIIKFEYYQALGGEWTVTPADLTLLLASLKYNPRRTSWESVVNPPERFPVVDHEWDLVDMVGMKQVVDEIINIRDIILSGSEAGVSQHVSNKNNPHEVTKEQVGLGKVSNYALATEAQARIGEAKETFMSAYLVKLAIEALAISELDKHKSEENPHGITPALIGAASLTQLAGKLGINETAANSYKFVGLTFDEAAAEILKGTAANALLIGGKTIDELKGEVLSDKVDNADKLNGKTLDEILEMIPDIIEEGDVVVSLARNAELLNNVSLADIYKRMDDLGDAIVNGTVNNALNLEGNTLADINYQQEVRAQALVDTLHSELLAPLYQKEEAVTRLRFQFGAEKYYDLYNFDLVDVPSSRIFESLKAGINHTFIISFSDYIGLDSANFILTVPTYVDNDRLDSSRLVLGSPRITPLEPTDLKPVIYVQKTGNGSFRIVISRIGLSRENGIEMFLSSAVVLNLSGYHEGILTYAEFNASGTNQEPTSDFIQAELDYPFSRNLVLDGTINSKEWKTFPEIKPTDNFKIMARLPGGTSYFPGEVCFTIEVQEWGLILINEDDVPLEYRIIIK